MRGPAGQRVRASPGVNIVGSHLEVKLHMEGITD